MALDFSGFGTQATVDGLAAEYQRLALQLANLPVADVSDQGRSITSKRTELLEAMAKLREEAIKIGGSQFVVSRMRA